MTKQLVAWLYETKKSSEYDKQNSTQLKYVNRHFYKVLSVRINEQSSYHLLIQVKKRDAFIEKKMFNKFIKMRQEC